MSLFVKYLCLLVMPVVVFASGSSEAGVDIIPRTVNFLIFAAILYYLIADPIKNLYRGRINSIKDALEAVDKKLEESRLKKEEAISRVNQAKIDAKSYLSATKKEIELLRQKLENELENELENLQKSHNEQIEIERRRATRAIVSEILDDIFADKDASLNQEQLVNIVLKKVA